MCVGRAAWQWHEGTAGGDDWPSLPEGGCCRSPRAPSSLTAMAMAPSPARCRDGTHCPGSKGFSVVPATGRRTV